MKKKVMMHSTASPAVEKDGTVQDMHIVENWAKEREMRESDKNHADASHTRRWKKRRARMKSVEGEKGER